ncbi:hypothetical protein ACQP0C_06045 [Nocardia sp. CA-129566]
MKNAAFTPTYYAAGGPATVGNAPPLAYDSGTQCFSWTVSD